MFAKQKAHFPLLWTTFLLCFLHLFTACRSTKQQERSYTESVERWHAKRLAALKKDDGWLSLAGLYPLPEGEYTFGADSANDIVFPPGKAADSIGTFIVNSDRVRVKILPRIAVRINGSPVGNIIIYNSSMADPPVLTHGSLRMYVIERGGKLFLRLKDTKHPRLTSFEGIDRFPVSKEWRVKAKFKPNATVDSINVSNVLGQTTPEPLHGKLVFSIDGKEYSLAPLGDPGGDEFFIIFGDETNGETTYGGGRYIYADTPGKNGITYIDFNKAYNPPCVFSAHATCPLPPPENRLPIKITAGEKNYGTEH